MYEQWKRIRAEAQDLQRFLQDPKVYGNPREVARIGKRMAELGPLIEHIDAWERAQAIVASAAKVAEDPELRALAEEEAASARETMGGLEAEIRSLLLPRDPRSTRNAVLEIRAGTGGEEAALFAAELLRMYLRYAQLAGWKADVLSLAHAEGGGLKEAIVRVDGVEHLHRGIGPYGALKFEGGVHRVQRIPATEAKGRVHTSAVNVGVLPEAEEGDLSIRSEDLRIDTFRSGGAGGQHVNKTESAVRITHVPTGIVVSCQSERSQLQNRARAMELLRTRLVAYEEERRKKEEGSLREKQMLSGDRSDKIRTYNFPQDRVTDHRISQNFHNIPSIMEGNIEDLLSALRKAEAEQALQGI
jgi:peptide chain release factor 1